MHHTIYLNIIHGNDDTAAPDDPKRPYRTMAAALAARAELITQPDHHCQILDQGANDPVPWSPPAYVL
jgi:hypothetical protein